MDARITREVLEAYVHCKYKAHLVLKGQPGTTSEYAELRAARMATVRETAITTLIRQHASEEVATGIALNPAILTRNLPVIIEGVVGEGSFAIDGLQRVPGASSLGHFHYIPLLFAEGYRLRPEHRLLVEIFAQLVSPLQGLRPNRAVIWLRAEVPTTIRLSGESHHARRVLADLNRLCSTQVPPHLILNNHCTVCQFRQRCHEQAVQEDNLSLLQGLKPKEIGAYARKGILTVAQLAHTFRPRRSPKKTPAKQRRHFALQAMAIRDRRIYVLGTPEVPTCATQIYMDVESDPDSGFVYLIGLIIVTDGRETRHRFWADGKDQETEIFEQFVAEVSQHASFQLFCYGSFEREFVVRMRKQAQRPDLVDAILAVLVNTLSLVYAHLYFPTYSNGLKDIGRCIGARWTEPEASGIQSIVWRSQWAATGDERWKQMLITYNEEDCEALQRVTELARSIATKGQSEPARSTMHVRPPISLLQDVEKLSDFRTWRAVEFADPNFAFANERAYFDYQRERVYVRTSDVIRRARARTSASPNRQLLPTKRLTIVATHCPACQSERVLPGIQHSDRVPKPRLKRAFDLAIRPDGVRRRVIHCRSSVHRCEDCGTEFVPDQHQRLDKHFHGLKSWVMLHHVEYRQNLATVRKSVEEIFGIRIGHPEMLMLRTLMVRAYEGTYAQMLRRLLDGPLLHVDETEAPLRTGKGYVWVFTNMDTVIYVYRQNREGDFLHEMLKDFRGVLVSDFYAAYDGLACAQQKCLIHLIRDMNQELLDNPFDGELKAITQRFSTLLRKIIATVDEHGLRRRWLQPHQEDVNGFFQWLATETLLSDAAVSLQMRLLKHCDKLFTFLCHDGIPWNNNNAEHAIKQYAYYREQSKGAQGEVGLREHLTLLSIRQTCAYQGTSFFKFLLSKEMDVTAFGNRRLFSRQRGFTLELYPEGFIPSHFSSKHKKKLQQEQCDLTRQEGEEEPAEA